MSADLRGYSYALRSKLAQGLSPSARHVAWVLLSYANKDMWAWPRAASLLVQGTGYSRSRVMALLDELVKAGWAQRRSFKEAGVASEYLLTIPQHLSSQVAQEDTQEGAQEDAQEDPQGVSCPQDTPVLPARQGVSCPQDTISTRGTNKELPLIVGGGQRAPAPPLSSPKRSPKTQRQGEQRGDSRSPNKVKKGEVKPQQEAKLRQDAMRHLEALEAADPRGLGATSSQPSTRPRRSPDEEAERLAKLAQEANP